ncbi:nitroreductase family protein [Tengunoibacter tsumagoiensis]|uniref:Nitroreductase n=1 Tax=Tengunoibacter tsumagoiensis TaxID=2014871 RepID=A0A402A0N1_9CHLR|nr:nitroreductase family protein [Tengunoibacter tsumagoiensis]GCE12707.1 nitroreductase [Tengunoibacter tsumagoiensis]
MTGPETRPITSPLRSSDLATLLRSRRSVRKYQDRPVERQQLEQILEAARWAPSPHGRQPWRFVVLTRPEAKAQLADQMGESWQHNLQMDGQDEQIVHTRLTKSRQRISEAPAIIIPCLYLEDLDQYPDARRQSDETTMAIQSLGAAVQNMLLMAYDLGLDTGWMCAPLFCPEVVCATLNLDTHLIPHALITVGYAAADPQRRPRLPLDTLIVHFD